MIYKIAGLICHQLPERSIFIGGEKLPFCARCTGIYGSIFIFLVYFLIRKRFKGNYPPKTALLIGAVCCLIPFMYDGGMSYLGIHETDNFLRIVTGSFAGLPLSFLALLLLNIKSTMDEGSKKKPIIKNLSDFLPLGLCLVASYMTYTGKIPWHIPALISVLGFIFFFGLLIFIAGRALYEKLSKRNIKKRNT